jgi:hypothetical protein
VFQTSLHYIQVLDQNLFEILSQKTAKQINRKEAMRRFMY